ncbi:tetratricopeptide repeat protein [Thermotoga sp. KOL6]|uniref:tetratricopeptide repeat protein n=1 Tax=Thermotoga sp. KOL6 TaxID=126741 RepID=UPI000C75909C|nr:tetratricopeptide repeat protein [Thermotoga sp. KOL6]PLV59782.1 hypothetical protein AS005_00315 [Thermotoga sp. KOL6]
MKTKKGIFLLMILFVSLVVALDVDQLNNLFYEARRDHDIEKILFVIKAIESTEDHDQNAKLLTILADAYLEYGLWGVKPEEKEEIYEVARRLAEKALKLDPSNGRASYIAGAAIGRLAQYKGIIKSLFMLGDFDGYIKKAIKLLNEEEEEGRLYKTFAYIAMGMRYRDVPWPLYNYKKSEEFFEKALQLTPNYSNIYLEMGYLYLKMKDYERAKEMFQKVISMEPHPWLVKTHEEAAQKAQEELSKLK